MKNIQMLLLKNSTLYLFLVFVLSSAGCKSVVPTTTKSSETVKTVKSTGIKSSNGPYHPSKAREMDLVHTKLDLSFNWEKKQVNGIATLILTPYFYPQDSIVLDAKGFDLHAVKLLEKNNRNDLKYKYDNQNLVIKLNRTYSKFDTVSVEIEYTAKPDELPVNGSEAIHADKGLYFINADGKEKGKPRQIWTQGETEASSKWFPTIDAPNERTTQEMYITIDTGFTVLSNGEFIYSIENGDGTKTDYWKMTKPHAPYLFMLAIGNFVVVEDSWNGKQVNYYVEPEFEKYAKGVFGNTPEMLEFFSQKLNYPFPWNKYSQVVVRDFVSGAMENTTASIFMEGLQIDDREMLETNWDYIIAHELFHHWFGDLVTCESWSNLPLNESFANYSEYLWSEYKYGKDEADLHSEKELIEYLEEAETKQEPLIRFHYYDKEEMFDRHSYNKGGRVLHMLRNLVGDKAFFESLSYYLKQHQYQSVEIHDLRLAFEKVTGKDLNWFFNQWFLKPGHPELLVEQTYSEGMVNLKVKQLQDTTFAPVYILPVKVQVFEKGVPREYAIEINQSTQSFSFKTSSKPDLVVFDSDYKLLGTIDHKKSKQELIFQYKNSPNYLGRKFALEAIFEMAASDEKLVVINEPEVKEVLFQALNDPFWAIRDFVLNNFFTISLRDPAYFEPTVEKLALNDPKPEVRANAIYFLSRNFSGKYKEIYRKALEDKAYSVVAAGLSSYLKTGDSLKVVNLADYEGINNLDISLAIANFYLSTSDFSKYPWFKEKLIAFKGKPRALYNMLFFFGQYVKQITEEEKADAKSILTEVRDSSKYDVIRSLADSYLKSLN